MVACGGDGGGPCGRRRCRCGAIWRDLRSCSHSRPARATARDACASTCSNRSCSSRGRRAPPGGEGRTDPRSPFLSLQGLAAAAEHASSADVQRHLVPLISELLTDNEVLIRQVALQQAARLGEPEQLGQPRLHTERGGGGGGARAAAARPARLTHAPVAAAGEVLSSKRGRHHGHDIIQQGLLFPVQRATLVGGGKRARARTTPGRAAPHPACRPAQLLAHARAWHAGR